jgi:hypothetical protein
MVGGIMWGGIGMGGGIPAGGIMFCLVGPAMGAGAAGRGMSSGGSAPPSDLTGIPIDLSLLVKLKEKIGTRWQRAQSPDALVASVK